MPLICFYIPMETMENLWFLMFSGGIESDQWQEMGLRYIKKSVITISRDIAYSMNRQIKSQKVLTAFENFQELLSKTVSSSKIFWCIIKLFSKTASQNFFITFRSWPGRCSTKKGLFKNFKKLTGKDVLQPLLKFKVSYFKLAF